MELNLIMWTSYLVLLFCYDENFIGKLLGMNPDINFEYNHDFTIEISFNNYLPISIKINGWEVVVEEI